MLKDRPQLKAVLSHHVVDGVFTYRDIAGKTSVATIDQKALKIDAKGLVTVDGAKIIRGDIKCKNGYIQVVDKVLVP